MVRGRCGVAKDDANKWHQMNDKNSNMSVVHRKYSIFFSIRWCCLCSCSNILATWYWWRWWQRLSQNISNTFGVGRHSGWQHSINESQWCNGMEFVMHSISLCNIYEVQRKFRLWHFEVKSIQFIKFDPWTRHNVQRCLPLGWYVKNFLSTKMHSIFFYFSTKLLSLIHLYATSNIMYVYVVLDVVFHFTLRSVRYQLSGQRSSGKFNLCKVSNLVYCWLNYTVNPVNTTWFNNFKSYTNASSVELFQTG